MPIYLKLFRDCNRLPERLGSPDPERRHLMREPLQCLSCADSVPNLMALEAQVELESVRGSRRLDLQEFILGNRKTAKADDELVTGLLIPKPSANAFGAFEKLGARKYLVISIVMTGVVAEWNEDQRIGKFELPWDPAQTSP